MLCTTLYGFSADWSSVRAALKAEGKLDSGVLVFELARLEVNETVNGTAVKPPLVLHGLIAFQDTGGGNALMTAELPLLQSEVPAIVNTLRNNHLDISAIHNHEIGENPRNMYIHMEQTGSARTMAEGIAKALAMIKDPQRVEDQHPTSVDGLDANRIHDIIGGKAEIMPNDTLDITVMRKESSTLRGRAAQPPLGFASEVLVQALGGGKAAVNVEYILLAKEVNPVISILRLNGFKVSAVHNHFLTDSPRWFYLHAFGAGDSITLARAVRAAFLQTNSK